MGRRPGYLVPVIAPVATNGRVRVGTLKAAEIAGVTKRTIYNWINAGRVEYVRTPTAGIRIYVDTLLRYEKASQ